MKKYIIYFCCQIAANVIWAFVALPRMGEQGTGLQIFWWLLIQFMLPLLLCLPLSNAKRYGYWLTIAYGFFMILFGLGTAGWALMGVYTPIVVYVVCGLFLITGFGTTYHAMKDLNIGQKKRRYPPEDEWK